MRSTLTLSLFSLFFLCACSSVKPPPDVVTATPTAKEIKKIQDIKAFTIKGVMAVRDINDGFSANFYWTQNSPSSFSVKLFGPMGAGNTYIKRQGNTITVKTTKETFTSNKPDELIQRATGYPLPIGKLYFWLRGLSTNNAEFNPSLNEGGWQILIKRTQNVHELTLPELLSIKNGALSIKVKINAWTIK